MSTVWSYTSEEDRRERTDACMSPRHASEPGSAPNALALVPLHVVCSARFAVQRHGRVCVTSWLLLGAFFNLTTGTANFSSRIKHINMNTTTVISQS